VTGTSVDDHGSVRWGVTLPLAVAMGGIGCLAAWVLLRLIWFLTNLLFWHRVRFGSAEAHTAPWASAPWTVLIVAAGGLIAGLAIRYGHDSLRGHGIPEVMEAVALRQGRIPPRVAALKPLVSALVIGTGGPFGAEGPIIQTGAALGSVLGQWLPVSVAERRALIACGAAAGMTGIFGTPAAAVLLPVELFTFEFSLRAIAPAAVAAGVAAALRGLLLGSRPLFFMHATPGAGMVGIFWCLGLGLVAGLEAVGLTRVLYWLEDMFAAIPGAGPVTRPLIGAVCVGLIALAGPEVLGVGYDLIRLADCPSFGDGGRGTCSPVHHRWRHRGAHRPPAGAVDPPQPAAGGPGVHGCGLRRRRASDADRQRLRRGGDRRLPRDRAGAGGDGRGHGTGGSPTAVQYDDG
jgi:CIC family chloride channel protein